MALSNSILITVGGLGACNGGSASVAALQLVELHALVGGVAREQQHVGWADLGGEAHEEAAVDAEHCSPACTSLSVSQAA